MVGACKRNFYNYKVYILIPFSATNYQYMMSQITQLVSEKGKKVLLYEPSIHTLEHTAAIKLIFRCENRDCKDKIMQLFDV